MEHKTLDISNVVDVEKMALELSSRSGVTITAETLKSVANNSSLETATTSGIEGRDINLQVEDNNTLISGITSQTTTNQQHEPTSNDERIIANDTSASSSNSTKNESTLDRVAKKRQDGEQQRRVLKQQAAMMSSTGAPSTSQAVAGAMATRPLLQDSPPSPKGFDPSDMSSPRTHAFYGKHPELLTGPLEPMRQQPAAQPAVTKPQASQLTAATVQPVAMSAAPTQPSAKLPAQIMLKRPAQPVAKLPSVTQPTATHTAQPETTAKPQAKSAALVPAAAGTKKGGHQSKKVGVQYDHSQFESALYWSSHKTISLFVHYRWLLILAETASLPSKRYAHIVHYDAMSEYTM